MERNLVGAVLFFSLLSTSSLASHVDQDPPYESLIPYYQEVSDGLIDPVIPRPVDPQDWFKLDVEGFVSKMGTEDFLGAKEKFYSELGFDRKTQRHEPAYEYMDSWTSNFHPPIKQLTLPREVYVKEFSPGFDPRQETSEFFNPEFQKMIDRETRTHLTSGNKLKLLPNGDSFQQKLRMARETKRFFFGIVMVYMCEPGTESLLNEFANAVKRGADVRLITEGLWRNTVSKSCMDKMEKAGIQVLSISEVLDITPMIGVMHNKFWIRDGEEAIIGGQNMHDSENFSTGFNHKTRDTDLHIQSGPAVTDLMAGYIRLWDQYKRKKHRPIQQYEGEVTRRVAEEIRNGQRGSQFYSEWLENPETRMNGVCRFVLQDGGAETTPIASVYYRHAEVARRSIQFTSPKIDYDLDGKKEHRWNNKLIDMMRRKALTDGITVDGISNGYDGGNGELTQYLQEFHRHARDKDHHLLAAIWGWLDHAIKKGRSRSTREVMRDLASVENVRTWAYMNFIHAKQWYFDRLAVAVGSYNMDLYSAETSHEATLVCLDGQLREQVEKQFTLDLVNSVPVTDF